MSVGVSYPATRPVARLHDAVDVLVELDPVDLTDAGLADELIALRREMDRQEAVFARLAHAAACPWARGARMGRRRPRRFCVTGPGCARATPKPRSSAARCPSSSPRPGSAWRAGEISTGATRTIVAARVAEHDDTLVACEPELLALARRGDLRVATARGGAFPEPRARRRERTRDRDGLHISQLYDGRTVISGELSNLGAETVVTALHAYVDPPIDDDTRTTSQRYAAALVRMAEVAITHLADDHRTPTQVSIVVDWATLTEGKLGRLDGEFTGPIHPQDIQRALCDSSISRVVTGPDSMPLDVGRTLRVPPAPMRRAVVARDQGCRFAGCNRPPGWCQAHHTTYWTNGGETKVSALILFCDHHHHVVHQPDWIVEFDGRDLRIIKPDGTEVT